MTKLLIIASSAETEKINISLAFAKNQKAAGHDVRFILFGPSEAKVANDAKLASLVKDSFPDEKPKACIFVAENSGVKDKLSAVADLVRAGQYITSSIDEGYTPVSF